MNIKTTGKNQKKRGVMMFLILALNIAITNTVLAEPAPMQIQKYPNVIAVEVRGAGNDRFDFDATISSQYDTPQRYADAFRVTSVEGVELGVRILFHDHASEQPFTRDLYGVQIKAGVKRVMVQARDQKYGYGGKTVTVDLPGR